MTGSCPSTTMTTQSSVFRAGDAAPSGIIGNDFLLTNNGATRLAPDQRLLLRVLVARRRC